MGIEIKAPTPTPLRTIASCLGVGIEIRGSVPAPPDAPCLGVGIEIKTLQSSDQNIRVAPCLGAGIERLRKR